MFERVTVRQRSSTSIGQPIDLGVLAEALLFYSDVVLVADYPVLRELLTSVAPDVLLELVESGFLRLAYEADRLAVVTEATQLDAPLDHALRALARLLARQAAREVFECVNALRM